MGKPTIRAKFKMVYFQLFCNDINQYCMISYLQIRKVVHDYKTAIGHELQNLSKDNLYGLGYPRQPYTHVTLTEVTFSLFLCKIHPNVIKVRQLAHPGCLTLAGRVTLESGASVLHN